MKKVLISQDFFHLFKETNQFDYALASAAIKFNAEPATNQPI
ncbi:MAG TPA: hypothetical protein VIV55_10675 [Flavobacterium sp.]